MNSILNSTIRLTASGPVSTAVAWRRYRVLALWPTWSPQLRKVISDDTTLVAGSTGVVCGPLGVRAEFTVLTVDRQAKQWSWEVRRWPLTLRLQHGVEPGPEGVGSSTWLVLRGPLPVLVSYAPIAWFALHRLVSLEEPGPRRPG